MAALLTAASSGPATVARTVLLVHGYRSSPSAFDAMRDRLANLGIPSIEVGLPGEDNIANAEAIRDLIAARGLTSVDIVAHSMGGLSARWYAKALGGSSGPSPILVHYVSLATPHYGLAGACLLPPTDGGQLCPASPFLAQLNEGDDTPGATAYTSIISTTDGLVPEAASRLDGGACLAEVSGVDHFGMRTDAGVFRLVVQALRGDCPGTFH